MNPTPHLPSSSCLLSSKANPNPIQGKLDLIPYCTCRPTRTKAQPDTHSSQDPITLTLLTLPARTQLPSLSPHLSQHTSPIITHILLGMHHLSLYLGISLCPLLMPIRKIKERKLVGVYILLASIIAQSLGVISFNVMHFYLFIYPFLGL